MTILNICSRIQIIKNMHYPLIQIINTEHKDHAPLFWIQHGSLFIKALRFEGSYDALQERQSILLASHVVAKVTCYTRWSQNQGKSSFLECSVCFLERLGIFSVLGNLLTHHLVLASMWVALAIKTKVSSIDQLSCRAS